MTGSILRYQLVRIMKKFFYHKEKIDELLTDKSTIQIQKSQISDFPSSLQPASHTHTKSEISDFPSTMPPSAHTHTKAQITDFNHSHTKSEISDFPSTMPPSAHTHTKAQITDFPSNASSSADGLMSKEDKATFDSLSYDTGWVNLKQDSDFNATQSLRIRRIGNIVRFEGAIQPKTSGYTMTGYSNLWNVLYDNLPEQFRPSRAIICSQKANTKRFFGLWIHPNGNVEFGRFSDQGSGEYEMSANLILYISATYFV